MPQIDTPNELSRQQEKALECLLAGDTVTAAAKSGRIDRSTLHRWLREHCEFQAAYNGRRRELQNAAQVRLLRLAEKAVDCVVSAVENGDVKTGLRVLEGLGLLSGEIAVGPEDVEGVKAQQAVIKHERFLSSFGISTDNE